jgi:2-polyprenyl-6-methoxyphenol hydroxylase-like FAD-dependent oxidoreductase
MAGLLAAKVLSDRYNEVIILERDELPDRPANRPGTPQDHHPHRLQDLGKSILEKLFPGWTQDLLAEGAYDREGKEMHLISPLAALQFPYEKDEGYSRPLLEWVIRRRVMAEPRIRVLQGHEAVSLRTKTAEDRVTVSGVRVKKHRGSDVEDLQADLVVDASGRYSRLPTWLEEMGFGKPETEILHARLAYSSRYYRIPEHLQNKYSTVLIDGDPSLAERSGVFSPIEDGLAETTIYGAGGHYPPVDPDKYEQAAAELINPLLAEILAQLEPAGNPRGFRVPECRLNHYESMPAWPTGLLVIGDSICNFDPIYGQGISVAAAEADELGKALEEVGSATDAGWELKLLQRFGTIILPAWWTIVVADLRWPGVNYEGPLSRRGIEFCQKYLDIVRKQALQGGDMELFGLLMSVQGLDQTPSALFGEEAVRSILIRCKQAEWLEDELEAGETLGVFLERNLPAFDPAS